jgi:alpha/beta superfamily hydrolase
MLGGTGLVGAVFLPGVAGCSEEGQGSSERTMISEPEEPEIMQEEVGISTPRGTVRGVLHPPDDARGAVVMVGGAGGGIHGPSSIYEKLATSLQTEGAAALRLEYRIPNFLHECVYDVLAAIAALGRRGVDRAVLVGWSFGGAVVISAGAESEAVVGVATVASQTYGAGAVGELSPEKSLLLLHGTADRVLPDRLSRDLVCPRR